MIEQLDQSLRGAGQGGPPLFWLADPWEVQGVSKLGGEGLRGRSKAESSGLGWVLNSGPNYSPLGSEEVRLVSKNSFSAAECTGTLFLLRLTQGYGGVWNYYVWLGMDGQSCV